MSRAHFSITLSAPDSPPRRWPKRLAIALAATLILFGGAVIGLTRNLTYIARWAVERAVPGAKAEIGEVRLEGLRRLVAKEFVLRDRTTGKEVFRLASGSVFFSFDAIRRRQLGEIRLDHPRIHVSPGLANILPAGGSGGGGIPAWLARRIVCDYAEIAFDGFGPGVPSVSLKCAFDWPEPGRDPDAALGLTVWDVQVSAPGSNTPFLVLDLVEVSFTTRGLLSGNELAETRVKGGSLVLGADLQNLLAARSGAAPSVSPAAAWLLRSLLIERLAVRFEDRRKLATNITFQINTTLKNLSLAEAAQQIGEEEQSVEIADVEILSPYDPLTKVLTLRSVVLRFTLGGLLRSELAGIRITDPSIYVGPDLFWYMEEAQRHAAEQKAGAPSAWKIGEIDVVGGRLIIGSSGRARYGLPLNFYANIRDVALDNLATLKLRTAFQIPAQKSEFPSYQLGVATREGDLQFAYPPEKNENNLVGKIYFDGIRWRQFEAADAWLAATFDQTGINGDFGGRSCGGYLSGGFSFLFEDNAPWIGWLSGDRVDLQRLTDLLAPQNFRMTGPLNFKLQMDAFGPRIQRVKSSFHTLRPGRMRIGKLDQLLANIPETWSNLKQSSTRLALETLRDFDYTKADGNLWFVDGQGRLGLKLQGPQGSRNIDVVLHADESTDGRWKQHP